MSPTVRRQKLLEVLCQRRRDTYANLAREFGVSVMTVRRDVQVLMELHHPIVTICGRYGGGVSIMDGYDPYHITLTPEEKALLQKLSVPLTGRESEIMNRILAKLAS